MEILDPNTTRIQVDFDEADQLSVDLLQSFVDRDLLVSTVVVALLMSAGRLLSPGQLSDDDEAAFVQAALDWTGAYFAEGELN